MMRIVRIIVGLLSVCAWLAALVSLVAQAPFVEVFALAVLVVVGFAAALAVLEWALL